MAEESPPGTTSLFDLDPNGTVDLDDLPTTPDAPATARASTPDADAADAADAAFDAAKPDDLPPELEARWEEERRKHQRNYSKALARLTKDREGVQTYRQKAEIVDRFFADPQYAAQTIEARAKQLGYEVRRPDSLPAAAGASSVTGGALPAHIVQAAQDAFADNPDLAFLAPMIASVSYKIAQAETRPLQDEAEARKTQEAEQYQRARADEFTRMAEELQDEGIDWQEHEDEMTDRLTWIQNALAGKGSFIHPKYGSLLRLLHTSVAGPRASQAEAGKRLQKAMENRTSTGTATRSPGVNVEQLIREATTDQDRWKIAFQAAKSEVPATFRR